MRKGVKETITCTPRFNWGAASDKGKVRRENQDTYLADTELGLFWFPMG